MNPAGLLQMKGPLTVVTQPCMQSKGLDLLCSPATHWLGDPAAGPFTSLSLTSSPVQKYAVFTEQLKLGATATEACGP